MALAPRYRVIITNAASEDVEMHAFSSLKYGYSLNRGSGAELNMPLTSTKLDNLSTAPLNSWLSIYRWDDPDDQTTERLVWYGLLMDLSYNMGDVGGSITMRYEDRARLLSYRLVPRDYSVTSATDASQILWDLIDNSQQIVSGATVVGDLGIVQGAAPASKNRQPEKDLQNRTILETMIAFSEYIDGIDWEITPTPRNQSSGIFNTYYRGASQLYHKGQEIGVPLIYHIDETNELKINNVKTVDVQESGSDYSNDVLVLGATIEEAQLFARSENEPQQIVYGLFQRVQSETSISEQATLDDKADEELNARNNIPYNIKLSMLPLQQPRFGTFDVGDIFTFKFKFYDFRDFTRQYRLYRLTVTVDANGVETMDFELNNI